MSIKMTFEGGSFAIGVIAAAIACDQLPAWAIIPAMGFLLDLPGPRLTFESGKGWEFRWWHTA